MKFWLDEQFDQLDESINDLKNRQIAIMNELKKHENEHVSPALERAIRKSQVLSKQIDEKVPDL